MKLAVAECESVKGEWGAKCPRCRKMLPACQGPLRSWMSQRNIDDAHNNPPPPTSAMRLRNRIK